VARGFISPGEWDALSWDGYGARLQLPGRVLWLWFFLDPAVAFGLYHFSLAARLVFTMFLGFSAVLMLLGGMTVQVSMGSLLSYFVSLADGAILLMACTSPLNAKFR
jgi:hypothetical protein